VQDFTNSAHAPLVHRDRLALDAQPLNLGVAQALRAGDAFGVELARDAREAEPLGRHAEDAAYDLGLLLVDHQAGSALHAGQALVPVAVHAATDHVAALEPGLCSIADARRRLLPLGLVAPALQRGQQLRRVVRERDPAPVARRPDLDARFLDVADQHHRVDLVPPQAGLLDDDQLRERHRRRAGGGEERL
jgi:hypothetical protein